MELANSNIIIVAEQTPRSRHFQDLLSEKVDENSRVSVETYDSVLESEITSDHTLIIIDLMDFERSAFEAIGKLKSKNSSAKIIALHIYQSEELIQPLFEKGVDGYISSDPTRKEFFAAITKVLAGEKYNPERTL